MTAKTATLIKLNPVKSYATEANALKAVAKVVDTQTSGYNELRFFIAQTEDGRYFPVFVGEAAVQNGMHFHFNVIG